MAYLSTVDRCLVHSWKLSASAWTRKDSIRTLNNGRPCAKNDKEVQHERLLPSMIDLVAKYVPLFIGENVNTVKAILLCSHSGEQCTLAESLSLMLQPFLLQKFVDVP